ncbi:carotenoid oxygenase [Candidatus Roizmanbacteria bacterium CG_4_10_14_0_8_um_filter_33_9]|uniref:Carotenoid oxygenase n=1 Tax=Candidatus Roizmanbacteria bacterium CG_4_10_14_0_8_um_filter_33_9 TaxID=1974826 RepID=A0A2M7QGZ1_9BACT|nr:MAG: carotenoid oxygenase [Candidatus Roizmanbacteria bacterium CG_4_10_14_0_8_um_filter_33_9]
MKKNVIFDFDGTIANTLPVIFAVVNKLALQVGLKQLTWDEFSELRTLSHLQLVKRYYRIIPYLSGLIPNAHKEMYNLMQAVTPFDGMIELLVFLQKKNLRLGILSSNAKDNIDLFVQKYNLDMLDFIHTEGNLFGKDKALINIMKSYSLNKKETIYIGDETRDIDACGKIGLDIISVTWGFNTKESLQKHKPMFLVEKVSDLQAVILKT